MRRRPSTARLRTIPSPPPHIDGCRRYLSETGWNAVAGMQVRCFPVPHDATQTVGFLISADGYRFFIMTDAGRVTEEALSLAAQADTVVMESNYDVDMLMGGPYPHELKMRICQGNGHLSNEECAAALRQCCHPGLRHVFLCHLSENNNTPTLAYRAAAEALAAVGAAGSVHLLALPRQTPSPLFILQETDGPDR